MKFREAAPILLIAVVVAVGIWVAFVPAKRPNVLRELAGCYEATVEGSSVLARVDRAGILLIGEDSTPIYVTENNDGYAIVPQRRIYFTTAVLPEIVIDDAGPLLLRVSDDMTSFQVPGDDGGVRFSKDGCP